MKLSFKEKLRLKLIYTSCNKMGLEYIAGHLVAKGYINEQSTIVDLGGNLGNFSQEVVNRFNCTSYCIEPDPGVFSRIPESSKIKKYNLAVTDTDGQMDFMLSANNEANSFNPVIAALWGTGKVINVQTRSLQSLKKEIGINNIDVLKIDIEGSEIPLLKSLPDEELVKISQLSVEFHEFLDKALEKDTLQTIKRLENLGFLVVVYSAKKFADVLFINKHLIKLNRWQQFWFEIHKLVRHRGLVSAL